MTKTTNATALIEQAKQNGGALEFTVGGGTGNTLHTIQAIKRAGHSAEFVSGEWQSKAGMVYRLEIAK